MKNLWSTTDFQQTLEINRTVNKCDYPSLSLLIMSSALRHAILCSTLGSTNQILELSQSLTFLLSAQHSRVQGNIGIRIHVTFLHITLCLGRSETRTVLIRLTNGLALLTTLELAHTASSLLAAIPILLIFIGLLVWRVTLSLRHTGILLFGFLVLANNKATVFVHFDLGVTLLLLLARANTACDILHVQQIEWIFILTNESSTRLFVSVFGLLLLY